MATFRLCLNSSTLSNQTLGIEAEIEIAASAGFQGVELWMPSIHRYLDDGGTAAEILRMLDDLDLRVENAIGFAHWVVDDEAERRQGFEEAKRDMDLLAAIGCRRMAAPPMGAVEGSVVPLDLVAERFDRLSDIGAAVGVTPQLEMWGFAANLFHLSQLLAVAAQRDRPTSVLLDVFHLVRGGSGLDLGSSLPVDIEIVHLNDLPAHVPAETATDADRVLPGDGHLPLGHVVEQLRRREGEVVLSLELFDRDLWAADPRSVAQTGHHRLEALAGVT